MGATKEVQRDKLLRLSERQNVILIVLYFFYRKGREEVSLPEFLECIKKVQEEIPLEYEFSKRFLYSLELLEDLRDLEYQGFAHRFAYKHDAFLPKRYITLTESGKSHVRKTVEKFPHSLNLLLDKSVETTFRSYQEKIKLFARPQK